MRIRPTISVIHVVCPLWNRDRKKKRKEINETNSLRLIGVRTHQWTMALSMCTTNEWYWWLDRVSKHASTASQSTRETWPYGIDMANGGQRPGSYWMTTWVNIWPKWRCRPTSCAVRGIALDSCTFCPWRGTGDRSPSSQPIAHSPRREQRRYRPLFPLAANPDQM